MNRLRWLVVASVGAALAVLPACNKGGSSNKSKVAFVSNNPADFWTIAEAGTKKAGGEEADIEVIFKKPASGDAALQKEIIDNLVNQGVKAIAVSVIDPVNQKEYLDEIAAKVPLLAVDNDAPTSKRLAYIGTDNYSAGREVGKLVKEAMPGGGTIAIFVGQTEPLNARQRREGVLDELAGKKAPDDKNKIGYSADGETYGEYKLYKTYTDQPTGEAKSKQNAEDFLGQVKDDKVCLVGLWAYNPPAILAALKEPENKARLGKAKIVGFDENFDTLTGIQDGHITATVVQNPYDFGYRSVKLMAKLAKGDKSTVPAGGVEYVPYRVVTKEAGKDRLAVGPFRTDLEEKLGKK
jgi:ribose transport system substrate-binding protein